MPSCGQGLDGEARALVEMTNERMSVILEEPIYTAKDWSAEIVPDATIDDLDEVAIAKARMMFKKVHSRIPSEEVNAWNVQTFLGKCGLTRNGGITRAAIILLGKYESVFKLRPAVAQVTWTRRDKNQDVVDYFYEHRTNIFMQRKTIPTQAGFLSNPYANYGVVDNSGVDGTITWNHKFGKDLRVALRANFTYAKNEVKEYDEPESVKGTYRSLK